VVHTEQNSSGSPADVSFTVDSKVLISGSFKSNWNGETEEGTFEYVRDGRKMSLEIKLVEGQRQVLLIDGHQSTVLFSPNGERFTVSDIVSVQAPQVDLLKLRLADMPTAC
jgi:hypothetical protein